MFYFIRLISFLLSSNNSGKSEKFSSFVASIFDLILYKISVARSLPVSYKISFFNKVFTLIKYSIYSAISIISFCMMVVESLDIYCCIELSFISLLRCFNCYLKFLISSKKSCFYFSNLHIF